MFYYAEINSEYQVINKHCLSEESNNPNYILITEDLYTNGNELGDIVGQFYNALLNVIEIVDPDWDMGQTCWMRYKDSQMRLSTKLDNMDKTTLLKADIDHTHEGYANSDDLQALEDIIDTKANASHTHSEYASSTHLHNEYSNVNHNHNSNYAPLSHTHTEYVTTVDFNNLEAEVDGKANENHTHNNYATVSDLNELSAVVSGKANSSHTHNDIYYTETEINNKLATKADASHNHTEVYDVYGAAASALSSAQNYTDEAIGALSETVATKASAATLSSHTGNTAVHITSAERSKLSGIAEGANNYVLPSAGTSLGGVKSGGDVTISSGVITVNDDSHNHIISNVDGLQSALDSKAASGHNHDGVYYTETEIDTLLDGKANSSHTHTISNVTNLQSTLDGKANVNHGTHVTYSTTAPAANGTATVGTATTVSRSDHVHPAQTTVSGNAGTATKLATARTISLTGDVSGSTSFDGSGNVSITATVADDSHNHVIANIDGLQSALDGKSATSHNHNSAYISKDLQMTADNGDISISWSGKDVVAQFKALASGMYTAYSPAGCTNNPNSNESFRFMIHKTGSANYGWVMAYGAQGSVYTGYIDNGNWKGWKALFEAAPQPLWTGASYMTDVHTITPSKTLSQCRNGWLLLWSDYDPGSGANNTDFYASVINKRAYTGQVWNGGEWYCDVPSYSAGTATDSEQRVIKLLKIYDSKIVGTPNNSAAPRNDVVLRAVYEW